MNPSVLQYARKLMRRRKFSMAISLLEDNEKNYKGSFEYYLSLGTCCLYVGDFGNSGNFYDEARKIRVQNTELYLGQAILFLHKGDFSRALQYYLDVQTSDPENKIAHDAIEFIRGLKGNFDLLQQWFYSGKIQKFYPPLGSVVDTELVRNAVILGLLVGGVGSAGFILGNSGLLSGRSSKTTVLPKKDTVESVKPIDALNYTIKELQLTEAEKTEEETDVTKIYEKALNYFKNERDNAAHVEINRIINSGASENLKAKSMDMLANLREQTFDSLKDNFSYRDVERNHALYEDCYIIWDGRISNMEVADDGSMRFDMLEGYADKKVLEGVVPVFFEHNPQPPLDTEKPIRILGRVADVGGQLIIYECAYHQPVKGDTLPPL